MPGPPQSTFAPAEPYDPADDDLKRPEACTHRASPNFSVVSNLLEFMEQKRVVRKKGKRDSKREFMQKFFEGWRQNAGMDMYPVIRLLLPDKDRRRNNYSVKESKLATLYCKALDLDPKGSSDGRRLVTWKAPNITMGGRRGRWNKAQVENTAKMDISGDFSLVAEEVIRRNVAPKKHGELTVDEINEYLDMLSSSDADKKEEAIRSFVDCLTPTDQKWIIRIVLKDLKISMRETTVLGIFHKDAISYFNICSDICRVCWTLYDPNYSLPREDHVLQPFMAFRPMLCKRNEKNIDAIVKKMKQNSRGKPFIIEEKMDGERMQVHMRGREFRYFSRKDKNYTYLYGKDKAEGTLTKYLAKAIHENVEEVILDGEMLVYVSDEDKYLPFGFLKTAAKVEDPLRWVCFKMFDILWIKGKNSKTAQNLLTKSLEQRKVTMKKLIKPIKGRVEFARESKGDSSKDIKDELQRILEECGEGLVIKNPYSTYELNGRNEDWIKLKPDYMEGFGETLDGMVIGAYHGEGKRGGTHGSFLVGILKNECTGDEVDPEFVSVCKVGSGFSISDFEQIREKTAGKWTSWKKSRPSWFITKDEVPDEWIHPRDSFAVTIKAAEIIDNIDGYGAGKCLRFPRCTEVFLEPNWQEVNTLHSFWDMANNDKKLKRELGDNLDAHKEKRRRLNNGKAKPTLAPAFRGSNNSFSVKSHIFEGLNFWVIEGDKLHDKAAVETAILENGGDILQTAKSQGKLIRLICNRTGFALIDNQIKKNTNDILRPAWVFDSISQDTAIPLKDEDKYVLHYAGQEDVEMDHSLEPPEEEDVEKLKKNLQEVDPFDINSVAVQDLDGGADDESEDEIPQQDEESDAESDSESRWTRRLLQSDNEEEEEEGTNDNASQKVSYATQSNAAEKEEQPEDGEDVEQDMSQEEGDIFSQFVFYLDTKENAEKHGLTINNKTESESSSRFKRVRQCLEEKGGFVVDNLHSKNLTHIVISPDDTSRRAELVRRTMEPNPRRLVLVKWVLDCYNEDTILSEARYIPA